MSEEHKGEIPAPFEDKIMLGHVISAINRVQRVMDVTQKHWNLFVFQLRIA